MKRPAPMPVNGLLVPRQLLPALDWALRTAYTAKPPPTHLMPSVEALARGLMDLSAERTDSGPLRVSHTARSLMTATDDGATVSRTNAADTLGITPDGVSKLLARGRLVDVGTGRSVAITAASLNAEVARRDQTD